MSARKMPVPVVMIHGAFCGGWVFDGWADLFRREGYRVVVPDLRFHAPGAAEPALGHVSVIDYAADLTALIDGLGAAPILVGHSMGGLLAQMLAARGKARALILLAPSAPWGVLPSTPFELLSAQALLLAGDFWRKPLPPDRGLAARHGLEGLEPAMRTAAAARLVPESGLAMFEILHWPFDLARASAVEARHVTCPTLCFSGAADRITPPATVRRIARRYRGRVQYREISGASHWLVMERGWEELARHTLFWLSRLHAGAAAPLKE